MKRGETIGEILLNGNNVTCASCSPTALVPDAKATPQTLDSAPFAKKEQRLLRAKCYLPDAGYLKSSDEYLMTVN